MKIFMGILLACALVIMTFCILATRFKEHNLKKIVQIILSIGMLIVFDYELVLFVTNEQLNLLAHSIYFIASDWILYYMLQFSMGFVGSEFDHFVKRKLMIGLLVADSVSLLLNTIFTHMFSLYSVVSYNNENFYVMTTKPFFYIHYIIIIMLVTFCLLSLFYRVFHVPLFYRSKYLFIAVIMVIIVATNIVYCKQAIDFSLVGYAIEGIAIYYCVFVFTPQRLLRETLISVSARMPVGIMILDIDGKLLYNNSSAGILLDSEHILTDENGISFITWCQNLYSSGKQINSKDYKFYQDGKKKFLNISLFVMTDHHQKLQGCYIIIYDRTEEYLKIKEEQYLATHDELTALYNKGYFYKKADNYICQHPDENLLIICTDIKDFKMVNDLFGSNTGDLVLKNCAAMIKRKENHALIYGRMDNDIFAMLVRKSEFNEEQFVQQMQDAFSSCMKEGISYPFINYVGIYEITDRTLPISVMCDRAKLAITMIKGDYHQKSAHYDENIRENIRNEKELVSDLKEAIVQKQLKMFLQPQVSATGSMLGAEALIRWLHPTKGLISPGQFIPVFEKNGLISDVDKYMWETACKKLREWKQNGREDLYISVNISPRDFYFLDIYQVFTGLVEKYDINPKNLKLEITETAVIMDFKRQLQLIEKLRTYGFIVEMDDFGSGNSSLNLLKDIYVDILKIDMVFLQKSHDEKRSAKILQMIIALSKQLGMPVITEGVETIEQVNFLKEIGCDMFQGYYFAKPMSVEQFENTYLS